MNQQVSSFESLSVPKALAKFIIPSVVSQLAALILNLTDAFFVGRTQDPYQISAMTITMPLVMFVICIATIFGAGGNASVAAALGEKRSDRARTFSATAIYSALVIIIVFSVLLCFWEDKLLSLLGAEENSFAFCKGYVLWVVHVSCCATVFTQIMALLFTAEGKTRLAGIGISGSGILNAVLDPIFIFVLGKGIIGAGIATCIANFSSALFFFICWVYGRKQNIISLVPRYYSLRDGYLRRILSIGLPAGLPILLMNVADFLRNHQFSVYGNSNDLAAWGTVQKLGSAIMQIVTGISNGALPLISYNYSAGLGKRTRSLIRGSLLVMTVWSVAVLVLSMIFPGFFIRIFLPISDLETLASRFLRIYIISIFSIAYMTLLSAVFQAIGQWKTAVCGIVLGKVFLFLPALILFAIWWDVDGIVASQTFADTASAIFFFIAYLLFLHRHAEFFRSNRL